MLKVQHLYGGYHGNPVIKDVSLDIKKGGLFGIIGPNGSGKTTLLKIISGILPLEKGEIVIKGLPLQDYSAKELAKVVAVLSQHSSQSFSYTVKETVSLGRYAHQKGFFKEWSNRDEEIVQKVMWLTGIASFQDQPLPLLSGGERQRVLLAQALAQEPEILLLDEPTNHLDLAYQKELFDQIKKWTKERDLTVVSIFHDLNIAGLYCDRLLLLENGEVKREGKPNEVLKQEQIDRVYQTRVENHPHPKVPAPQIVLLPEKIAQTEEMPITAANLQITGEALLLTSPFPLRTMSASIIGSGSGWHRVFVNHYASNGKTSSIREETADFLQKHRIDLSEAIAMITAGDPEDVVFHQYEKNDISFFIVVTASISSDRPATKKIGSVNLWALINGELSETGFIQAMMAISEAKGRVLETMGIRNQAIAGMKEDGLLIAATQKGKQFILDDSFPPLRNLLEKAVYECLEEAVEKQEQPLKMDRI
ncbi:ATP-binding cassette domain-containing protein [Bacillaceae bacterium Marseille-Q3522]|nr:ATP-binding cassette domain-containing protein [Bacillaceae bacterium Marseille-Q3522]